MLLFITQYNSCSALYKAIWYDVWYYIRIEKNEFTSLLYYCLQNWIVIIQVEVNRSYLLTKAVSTKVLFWLQSTFVLCVFW